MWTTEAIIAVVALLATCAPLALYLTHKLRRRNGTKSPEPDADLEIIYPGVHGDGAARARSFTLKIIHEMR
ncbi:hypothetical protein P171DRAFT_428332 [Karstenula rhodostoma CBS 690.94]|uniref:Uncharacterized protein n=1 Tax=Karstenula rhodostoma CBS 690.94 TaxID=1392251 RepID=A0A9P4UF74_9PLEO|nr:hypothetical protein P171DRAFT_428332 [Karstenula rhodostoma CBS 690.94]